MNEAARGDDWDREALKKIERWRNVSLIPLSVDSSHDQELVTRMMESSVVCSSGTERGFVYPNREVETVLLRRIEAAYTTVHRALESLLPWRREWALHSIERMESARSKQLSVDARMARAERIFPVQNQQRVAIESMVRRMSTEDPNEDVRWAAELAIDSWCDDARMRLSPISLETKLTQEPCIKQREGFWLIGRHVRASNDDPSPIGGLWGSMFAKPFKDQLPTKLGDETYSVYCEYEGDHTKPYTVFLGYRVPEDASAPAELHRRFIAAGKYSLHMASGERPASIMKTWQEIWQAELERAYIADYEIHPVDDADPAEIYVGVK